ncbi:MAG: hypothetical protein IIB09_04250 [Bacteroidetes bacterium]|nr:hypothetical protein [Bacteroidota bacterium]
MNVRILALLVGSALIAPVSQAQIGSVVPETVVTWTASARPPSSASRMTNSFGAGDRVYITISAEILEGWRVYAINSPAGRPLTLELDALPNGIVRYGSPGETATQMGHDPGLDADYTYHDGSARVWQGLLVQDSAVAGEHVVTGEIRYAACNDEMCLPVETVPFHARFLVSH